MKTTHLFTLMAALAAGTAAAATTPTVSSDKGTNAGTVITNVATATFTDPSSTSGGVVNVASNPVTTTVQPKAAFNITYSDGNSDTSSTNTPAGAPTSYQTSAVPGQVDFFKYTAVNNGNSTQNITLVAPTTGNGGLTGNITTVKYYSSAPVDTNADGRITAADLSNAVNTAKEITTLTVLPQGDDPSTTAVESNTGLQDFYLVYVTPTGATGDVVGATPIGSGQQWNGTNANPNVTETATSLYYQYSKVTLQAASGVVGPNNFPAGNATATTYTSGTTTISELNDVQTAAPAKATTSVTFTNTLKNTGGQVDDFSLLLTSAGGTTVTFLTPTGAAFTTAGQTVAVTPAGGGAAYNVTYQLVNGVPTIIGLLPGDSASYQTKVDYTSTPSTSYTVTVGVDSSKDLDTVADDQTTNVVNVPGVAFGNSDNNAATAPTDTAATASNLPGQTVTLPLEIKNTGGSADTYYVTTPTLTFTVVDPTTGVQSTVNVTPKYYADTNCDGTADTPLNEITSSNLLSVAGGATSCVVMSVTIPANATVQTVSVNETLKGTLAGDTTLTVADTITVNLTNTTTPNDNTGGKGLTVTKSLSSTTPAVPGNTLQYTIVAKNTYNTAVKAFRLTESNISGSTNVFTYSYFKSVSATVATPALSGTSKVMYRYNNGLWTTSATPPAGTAGVTPFTTGMYTGSYDGVTSVDIAIDVNNDGDITAADYLSGQQQLTAIFEVIIK